jgi:hypothetical protein
MLWTLIRRLMPGARRKMRKPYEYSFFLNLKKTRRLDGKTALGERMARVAATW